jgi:tRNA threonylcarbamoyladenosine biosynthesis protein TsaB
MTFLAFDTSGEMCVLALADEDGTVKAVSVFEGRRTLSQRLMGELDGLLTRSGLTLADFTAFAVGLGPGSFTGVRVGVTTAKTLAQVTGKPLVGVGTLDAYAAPWLTHDDTAIVPVLPSRRGEVYAAVYQGGMSVEEPFAAPLEALTVRLGEMGGVIVCGSPHLLPDWAGQSLTQPWTPPEGLARIAARRLQSGDTDDPLGLVPLYVVAPSISTPKARPPAPNNRGARGEAASPELSSPTPPLLAAGGPP